MQKTFPDRFMHRVLDHDRISHGPRVLHEPPCARACGYAHLLVQSSPCYHEEGDFQSGYSAKVDGRREERDGTRSRELYPRVKVSAQFGFVDPRRIGRTHTHATAYKRPRALSLFSCFAFVRSFTFTNSLPQGSAVRSSHFRSLCLR